MKNDKVDYGVLLQWIYDHDFVLPGKLIKPFYQWAEAFIPVRTKMTEAENALKKGIKKLFLEQYPVIKKEGIDKAEILAKQVCLETQLYIEFFVKKIIDEGPFDTKTKNIIKSISVEEGKAPQITEPKLLKISDRTNDSKLSMEQWEKKCLKHNKNALPAYKFHKKRMDEFVKTMHAILLKHFPEIKSFNPEQKKEYDNFLMERYRVYRFRCEFYQRVLDYELDRSCFSMSKTILAETISKLGPEKKSAVKAIELRRLQGEKI
jgi:hypothetical protein